MGGEEALLALVAQHGGTPRLVGQLGAVLSGTFSAALGGGMGGGGGSDEDEDEESLLMHQMLPSRDGHSH